MCRKSIFLIALAMVLLVATVAGCTSPPAVKTGDNVTIDYIINSTAGTVYQTSYTQVAKDTGIYDASETYAPYRFQAGSNSTIAGIDEAVMGMKAGETKTVTVPPEKSYGPYNQSLVVPVNMSDLTVANITPHVNDTLQMSIPLNGASVLRYVRVAAIDAANNTVYIDYNRPHAGETLVVTMTVRKID